MMNHPAILAATASPAASLSQVALFSNTTDEVEIERASLGSFMLRKQGSKRSMRVSREDCRTAQISPGAS